MTSSSSSSGSIACNNKSRNCAVKCIIVLTLATSFFISMSNSWKKGYKGGDLVPTKLHSSSSWFGQMNFSNIPPFVIVSIGCSGSTAVGAVTRKILKGHGIPIWDAAYELFKIEKNPFSKQAKEFLIHDKGMPKPTNDEIAVTAMEMSYQQAKSDGKVILMKSWPGQSAVNDWLLHSAKAKFTHFFRSNVLDITICRIRDCMGVTEVGYSVFPNGTKANLCFQRRRRHDERTMAYINPTEVTDFLQEAYKSNEKQVDSFKNIFTNNEGDFEMAQKSFSYEDLFAYEYSPNEGIFQSCVKGWIDFLDPFFTNLTLSTGTTTIISPSRDIVAKILREDQNSRNYSLHSDIIYNYKEVKAILDEYDNINQNKSKLINKSLWRGTD